MIVTLKRDPEQRAPEKYTLGQMFADDEKLGETLEDVDRRIEDGGEKVYGATAIPRGRYPLTLSRSQRFGRIMPEVRHVPGFDGIRIHAGNTDADTLGCPLLGRIRTHDGVADCSGPNRRLIALIDEAMDAGESCWLVVE